MAHENKKQVTGWQAATVILTALLVAAGMYFGINMADMRTQLNTLQSNYAQLQWNYNSLESMYGTLQDNYGTLQDNYESLEVDYEALQQSFTELQLSYNQLEVENANLRSILQQYEQVPHDYYSSGVFGYHSNTYTELCDFLDHEFPPIRSYQQNVFDCSESSAYVEWALQNAGFDTQIAVGRTPWDQNSGYHAWLIVNTKDHRVAIEATALTGWDKFVNIFLFRTPGIVYSDDWLVSGWQNYYDGYDGLYNNIYEAVRHDRSIQEWNWWEVI
jgi:hypothetical protein